MDLIVPAELPNSKQNLVQEHPRRLWTQRNPEGETCNQIKDITIGNCTISSSDECESDDLRIMYNL